MTDGTLRWIYIEAVTWFVYYRVDISSTISDNYDKVPFVLVDCARNSISVQDPLSASFLDEAMVTTHDHFEPNVRSLSGWLSFTFVPAVSLTADNVCMYGCRERV